MEILLNDLVCFSLLSIKSSNKIKTILRTVHVLNKKNQNKKKKKKKKKHKKKKKKKKKQKKNWTKCKSNNFPEYY